MKYLYGALVQGIQGFISKRVNSTKTRILAVVAIRDELLTRANPVSAAIRERLNFRIKNYEHSKRLNSTKKNVLS